jgi:flagellar basal body-associated protein FliL
MNKKGDLTINIIVIAVIALLVLVILIAIFSGKIGMFNTQTNNQLDRGCVSNGGRLTPFSDPCPVNMVDSPGAYTDVDPGFKCCMPERN